MNKALKIWNATFVRRWHTHPLLSETTDFNGTHQARCTLLLLHFWPDASRLSIIDCLTHDQGELDAGDLPHPAKKKSPEARELLEDIEQESIKEQGFPVDLITQEELLRRKLMDALDAFCWMIRNKPDLRSRAYWECQRMDMRKLAGSLGIKQPFDKFLDSFYRAHGLGW